LVRRPASLEIPPTATEDADRAERGRRREIVRLRNQGKISHLTMLLRVTDAPRPF
jgi:hypothetical protein